LKCLLGKGEFAGAERMGLQGIANNYLCAGKYRMPVFELRFLPGVGRFYRGAGKGWQPFSQIITNALCAPIVQGLTDLSKVLQGADDVVKAALKLTA
jgi:TM2 domain-containing membrane protein YozV